MAHHNQELFCNRVKAIYPDYFFEKKVLDIGSMDINGSNKYLFRDCEYTGMDLGKEKNVDIVCAIEFFTPTNKYDVVISTEMLEHAKNWYPALLKMYDVLESGGLLLITAAGEGRSEHGTTNNQAWASPHTNDYYCNITNKMFSSALKTEMFTTYFIRQDMANNDFQFFGIK